ncbi:MAG TPA: metal-dependent hydrolase [Pseudonocardiaceae bacterium]
MGRSHALSGWCAGLAVAPFLGLDTIVTAVPFAAATAGYALLPDLDHPGARASRLLGPVTGSLSRALRAVSAALYRWTKGPRDEKVTGRHRHATHTLAAALLLAWLAAAAGEAGGPWAVVAILTIGLMLAVDALENWLFGLLIGAGLLWASAVFRQDIAGAVATELGTIGGWVGIAVGLGMFVHVLGDSVTMSGCPWLWPLRIAGETWYEIRPPRGLRFRTGGPFEQFVVVPGLTAAAALLLPGAWPVASTVATGVMDRVLGV